jgi:chromosome partitioning protein
MMAGNGWFDVIALAQEKGGVSKTTLARALAAYWYALGHQPALIDADPTGRLSGRHNKKGKLGAVPVIAEPEELVTQVIEDLRAKHTPVIIDTAGFRNRTTIAALAAADLAIIPLKAAAEDHDGALETYELIRQINQTPERKGRPIRPVMILTMTMRGTVIARHIRNQLEISGYPLLQAEMPHRVAYPEAGIEGLSPSVTDPDGAAVRDIAAIVHELMNLGPHEFVKLPEHELVKDALASA